MVVRKNTRSLIWRQNEKVAEENKNRNDRILAIRRGVKCFRRMWEKSPGFDPDFVHILLLTLDNAYYKSQFTRV